MTEVSKPSAKVKRATTPRWWRFPCVQGHESKDCGPACLASIASFYGATIALSRCREFVGTDTQGTSMFRLCEGANVMGFDASAGRTNPKRLGDLPLPAVLLTDENEFGHFVVLYKVFRHRVLIADPGTGLRFLSRSSLDHQWNGYVLLLKPTERLTSTDESVNGFGVLLRIAFSERWLIPLSLVYGLANLAIGFITALVLRAIVDTALPLHDQKRLRTWALAAAASFSAAFLVGLFRDYQVALIGERLELRLGSRLISNIFGTPLHVIEKFAAGEISSRITDVSNLRFAVVGALAAALFDLGSLVVMIGALSFYSLRLTLLVFLSLVTFLFFFTLFTILGMNAERGGRIHNAALNGIFVDCLNNIRVFRAFNAERVAQGRLLSQYKKWQNSVTYRIRYANLLNSSSGFVTALSSLLLLIYGTSLAMENKLSVGSMLLFYSMMGTFIAVIQRVSPTVGGIQQARVALERLSAFEEYQNQASTPDERIAVVCEKQITTHLQFNDLTFRYKNAPLLLRGGNISIARGEWIVLMGESGSGKSTIACLVSGLYAPPRGQIFIDNQDLGACPADFFRHNVSVVFQEAGLVRGSIEDNIRLGKQDASFAEIRAAAQLAQIDDVIRRLPRGYRCKVGAGGASLSSGEKQRVTIARALLVDTPILILDEATSHLDAATETRVLNAIRAFRAGKTTIVISHRQNVLASAERLIKLEGGTLKDCGMRVTREKCAPANSSGENPTTSKHMLNSELAQ